MTRSLHYRPTVPTWRGREKLVLFHSPTYTTVTPYFCFKPSSGMRFSSWKFEDRGMRPLNRTIPAHEGKPSQGSLCERAKLHAQHRPSPQIGRSSRDSRRCQQVAGAASSSSSQQRFPMRPAGGRSGQHPKAEALKGKKTEAPPGRKISRFWKEPERKYCCVDQQLTFRTIRSTECHTKLKIKRNNGNKTPRRQNPKVQRKLVCWRNALFLVLGLGGRPMLKSSPPFPTYCTFKLGTLILCKHIIQDPGTCCFQLSVKENVRIRDCRIVESPEDSQCHSPLPILCMHHFISSHTIARNSWGPHHMLEGSWGSLLGS